MKKHLKLLPALALLLLFVACKDDEEPPAPHEVGTWSLNNFAFKNMPNGFESWEGSLFDVDELTSLTSYVFTLQKDGTYTRRVGISGRLPEEDDGKWTLVDNELTLESEQFTEDDVFGVDRNRDNELWLTQEITIGLIPDIYFDTVTQAYINYLNTLTDEQLDSVDAVLTQYPLFDLVHLFEKETN